MVHHPAMALDDVFAQLRQVMAANAPGTLVRVDQPGELHLDAPRPHYPDRPASAYFGGVKIGKRYVSYHLMPVYADQAVYATISPALKKRMQGKSCFNFTRLDDATLAELAELTCRGVELYRSMGMI